MRIKLQDKTAWHGKFIWWPRVIDGHLVWLESVWRRCPPTRFDSDGMYTKPQYALTIPTER